MYGLIGRFIAVAGKRDELARILHEGSRGMRGCISYIVALDSSDDNSIWVTEVWESKEKHSDSLSSPAVQEAIAEGRPLIAGIGERFETEPVGLQD